MATKTSAELAQKVLQSLGSLAAGESAPASDQADILDWYQSIQEELETRQIGAWTYDAIPRAIFIPLANYIAARVAAEFGQDLGDPEVALMPLRRVLALPYLGKPMRPEFF